jgi:hypothetical protein
MRTGVADRVRTVALSDPSRVGSGNKPSTMPFEYVQITANHGRSRGLDVGTLYPDRLMQQSPDCQYREGTRAR